jgi:CRP-like cAMP-binding protein
MPLVGDVRYFSRGERLEVERGIPQYSYFVLEGWLARSRASSAGRNITTDLYLPGEVCPRLYLDEHQTNAGG